MWRNTPRTPLTTTSIFVIYCLILQLMCASSTPEHVAAPGMDQLDPGHFFRPRHRDQIGGGLRRVGRLYNQCSGRHLALNRSAPIRAVAGSKDPLGEIQFRSVTTKQGVSGVVLSGVKSKMFLCFNKRGRQILRSKGRDKKCMFEEDMSPTHYSTFKSLYNSTWYLAYNKKGDRLSGTAYKLAKYTNCELFSKWSLYPVEPPPMSAPGPKLPPSLLQSLAPLTPHRRRHHRRRKQHRRPQR